MKKVNVQKITETKMIMIFLVVNLIAIGIILSVQNYYFQVSQDQRIKLVDLTNAIHKSDELTANKTDSLILAHVQQDHEIHIRQAAILKNQQKLLSSSNFTNTTLGMIKKSADQVDSIVSRQKNNTETLLDMKQEVDRILNKTLAK